MLRGLPLKPAASFVCILLFQVMANAAVGFVNHMERGEIGPCVEFLKFCVCMLERDETSPNYVPWHKYGLYIYYY